jgi:hypothetical protein
VGLVKGLLIDCAIEPLLLLLQKNVSTSPPHRHFFKVIKVSLRSLTGISFKKKNSPLLPAERTQQRKCATLTEKSNQLWHTEPQFLIKTCRKRFWWLNSVVSQDRRVIKLHPCALTGLKRLMLIPISLPAIKHDCWRQMQICFVKVPVAQKRYTCELIALFSARLTGKQNSIVDFCQSNVIKCTFGMETGEEVYQDSPLLVLCVI